MNDLPPGWEWTTLGEVAETTLGKMLDRGKNRGYPEVPYLRNVNVQWGRIDLDDVLTMEVPPGQLDHFELRLGDLLICEGGEIGRCAIWSGRTRYMEAYSGGRPAGRFAQVRARSQDRLGSSE